MTGMSWPPTRRQVLLSVGATVLLGGGYVWSRFHKSLNAAEKRISGRSSTIDTAYGTLEYAVAGAGPPLLMIHGTGGGFDQGLRFASTLRHRGYKVISPSRFGYLRSDFPDAPSSVNQADAYVSLLDHLGVERIPIIGGSAGALSASEFALRHPDRCSALILLVPAANISGHDPVEMSAMEEMAVRVLLNSDFLYWSVLEAAPEKLIGTLLATDPSLLSKISIRERRRAFSILSDMMPIRDRTKGMLNDARLAGNPSGLDFARLTVPLLAISAADDRFGTAATASRIGELAPRAEVVILPDGGHIWLGHDEEIAQRMDAFFRSDAVVTRSGSPH